MRSGVVKVALGEHSLLVLQFSPLNIILTALQSYIQTYIDVM